MSFTNLQSYIQKLREEKEIVSIDCFVDPYLELAEIHRRVIAANGPALLFTNVKGKAFPVVSNLFGTKKRVDLAFGKKPEQFLRTAVRAARRTLTCTSR
jgi:UbiD family decarboxylase